MYRKIQDFINYWAYESEATLKVFNNLTDDSLNKKINENVRTAGRLACISLLQSVKWLIAPDYLSRQ
jgi:uncharacterized damage-inducible protein DinB